MFITERSLVIGFFFGVLNFFLPLIAYLSMIAGQMSGDGDRVSHEEANNGSIETHHDGHVHFEEWQD